MTRSVAELVEGLRDALPEITANNWTFSQQFLLKRLIREAAAALERLEASLKDAARLVAISDAARVELEAEIAALRVDAELGRVALQFVDRAGDVCDEDPAERICEEFWIAMSAAVELERRAAIDAARGKE
jgi:hypothetical protein